MNYKQLNQKRKLYNKTKYSIGNPVNSDLLQLLKATGICKVCEKRFKLLYDKKEQEKNYAYKLKNLVKFCKTCLKF